MVFIYLEAYCVGVSKRVREHIADIMIRMIWGLQVLLLTIAVVTALVEPNSMAAGAKGYSWERGSGSHSQLNITYGCVGVHCLAADNVEAHLFMDQRQLSRMLSNSKRPITSGTSDPNSPFCPRSVSHGKSYMSTACIQGGPKPPCHNNPMLRGNDVYCGGK